MSQISNTGYSDFSPSNHLPKLVITRGGHPFNPNNVLWQWTEDVFAISLNFSTLDVSPKIIYAVKRTLIFFAQNNSPSHLQNLFGAFKHFLSLRNSTAQLTQITIADISNYSAQLKPHERGRLGTLNGLIQKWVALDLPGIDANCGVYLQEHRKPGNKKGHPVRTRDPMFGPFSEIEYIALYRAVDEAYGLGTLPKWTAILTRILFACGGRISQYASLKVCDFVERDGSFVLKLPQVKQRGTHSREALKEFDLSPQTGRLIREYIAELMAQGFGDSDALFPEEVVQRLPSSRRTVGDLFLGHCTRDGLSLEFRSRVGAIAPTTQRLDFAPLPIAPKRFRYTFGTRLVEEGASKAVVADRLGHTDLQNVDCYFEASPKIVDNIDKAMDAQLAPLAAAFRGRLVSGEGQTTHKGALGSRIIDFRISAQPLASCAGKAGGCAFNKPVACYTCFQFEPWLDGPHAEVLARLEAEQAQQDLDPRIAKVNELTILAIRQVISEIDASKKQRGGAAS